LIRITWCVQLRMSARWPVSWDDLGKQIFLVKSDLGPLFLGRWRYCIIKRTLGQPSYRWQMQSLNSPPFIASYFTDRLLASCSSAPMDAMWISNWAFSWVTLWRSALPFSTSTDCCFTRSSSSRTVCSWTTSTRRHHSDTQLEAGRAWAWGHVVGQRIACSRKWSEAQKSGCEHGRMWLTM